MQRGHLRLAYLAGVPLAITACMVGPDYRRPSVQVPSAYKELRPADFNESKGWKMAQPNDAEPRGPWWEAFQDPQLNALEAQVNISNQNILAAEAQLRGARAAIRVARSDLFPTITAGAAVARSRSLSSGGAGGPSPRTETSYQIPIDLSYDLDVWGRIRRNVEANIASAEATAADLETVRLSMHAELAADYFALRGLDTQKQLLDLTVAAFERALQLTLNRYNQGIVSQVDVAQARTQLETTRAQAIDVGVQRAQFEHAIALLIGKPAAEFTIPPSPISAPPPAPLTVQPPAIPAGLPSELLERRPDIAAAERRLAAANAQIGIAQAAFFPTITLSGTVGVANFSLADLFSWPSRLWSVGASLTEIVFDAGRRKAVTEEAQASYDATVANYRQTVLTAFQGVEDNLAALRLLAEEAAQQENAVKAAEAALTLALNRYRGGVTTYLEVITAQAAALTAERDAIDILTRRMTAAVQLIQALGGGWEGLVPDHELTEKAEEVRHP
jgi:NodT family efflux transporter outer membrane factor (OMF) lipoprotein